MIGRSFISRHGSDLADQVLDERQKNFVERVRRALRHAIVEKSPFKNLIDDCRARYQGLALIPLQVSGYYAFDALAPFANQFEYLESVLENVPSDIGVLATAHPADDPLDSATLEYLRNRYSNFVWDPSFSEYFCASQYLVPDVDVVITYSSSLGPQCFFWGTRLISLGPGFFQFAADSTELAEIRDVLQKPPRNQDALLYWLLTRYSVLQEYVRDPDWLARFFSRSLKKYRSDGITSGFFDQIAPEEEIAEIIEKSVTDAEPMKAPVPIGVEALRRRLLESFDMIKNLQSIVEGNQTYIEALEDWKLNMERFAEVQNRRISKLKTEKSDVESQLERQSELTEWLKESREEK